MVGAVVVAAGYILAVLSHAEIWQLVVSTVVIGSGIGLAYGALPLLIMAAVPVTQTAAANSLNNLCRALGTATASAVAGLLLTTFTATVAGRTVPSEAAFVVILAVGAATALTALLIAVFIPGRVVAGPPIEPGNPNPADPAVGVRDEPRSGTAL